MLVVFRCHKGCINIFGCSRLTSDMKLANVCVVISVLVTFVFFVQSHDRIKILSRGTLSTSTVGRKVSPKPTHSSTLEEDLISVEKVLQGRGQSEGSAPQNRYPILADNKDLDNLF